MALGIITLISGLLIVAAHNVWVLGWPIVITILGWLMLISGIMRVIFPDIIMNKARQMVQSSNRLRVVAIVFFIIGLYLLYHAY